MDAVKTTDPRIIRTRRLLFQALGELLEEKSFEAITMQDIAERSTLNRGTIYLHYKDKSELLEAMIGGEFGEVFEARMSGESGTCSGGLRQLILAVCDFLSRLLACDRQHRRRFEPVVESAVRSVIRGFLMNALQHGGRVKSCSEARLRATAASWAICGSVLDWCRAKEVSADDFADALVPLVAGILQIDLSPAMEEG